jgi:hypothetical protein
VTASGDVLVVGSYPPIPVPAAAATLAVVQRAWADGRQVTVASPRPSAAHLAVPVAGVLSGRRLAHLQQHTSSDHLILVLERGLPVPLLPGHPLVARLLQWQTVRALRAGFGPFRTVTLVTVGPLGLPPRLLARLAAGTTGTLDGTADAGPPAPPGVTSRGPIELRWRDRPRQTARRLTYRILGRRAAPIVARLRARR